MSLKTKAPPPLEGAQKSQSQSQPRTVSEARYLPINPELNERINRVIEARPVVYEYYATLIREDPERAIRGLIAHRMFREEVMKRQTERQLPLAKEWFDKQVRSLKESMKHLLNRKVAVDRVPREKAQIDFTPLREGARIST